MNVARSTEFTSQEPKDRIASVQGGCWRKGIQSAGGSSGMAEIDLILWSLEVAQNGRGLAGLHFIEDFTGPPVVHEP